MLDELGQKLKAVLDDEKLSSVHAWREKNPGAPVVGFMPAYAPRELVYAAGGLAVGIWGGGSKIEIVHGDAYFQSYICHIPRSIIELAMQGHFKEYDGLVFPSICDVIRNLSGMWKLLFKHQWVKYLDLPQNLMPEIGGQFYQRELKHLARLILGREPDAEYDEKLRQAIAITNRQQAIFDRLMKKRAEIPHKIPIDEFYACFRSALVLPPEEHIELVGRYLELVEGRDTKPLDSIRVVLQGAFCEQPPIGLLRTIERAGCYIVNHDMLIGMHWFTEPLDEGGDPFASLVDAYLKRTRMAAFKYQDDGDRGAELVARVKQWKADGVLLGGPSFCDPALLERPVLADALKKAGIPYTSIKYAENTGQYQAIREQAGTFSDSVRLWG